MNERKLKCPHCGNDGNACVPYVAFRNAEIYGSNSFNVECLKCGKIILAQLNRRVFLTSLSVTDATRSDWGG